MDEATEGEDVFAETLAQVTEGVRVRSGVVDHPRRRDRPRRARHVRTAPRSASGA